MDEHFYIGRHPGGGRLPDDVDLVVDLTAEFDAPTLPPGIEYINLATLDACGPRLDKLRELIETLRTRRADKVAYIHCASGHGRSATVCTGLLIAKDPDLTIEGAEQRLNEIRSGVALSVGQKRTLAKLFERSK